MDAIHIRESHLIVAHIEHKYTKVEDEKEQTRQEMSMKQRIYPSLPIWKVVSRDKNQQTNQSNCPQGNDVGQGGREEPMLCFFKGYLKIAQINRGHSHAEEDSH